jgi:hypothetical protein
VIVLDRVPLEDVERLWPHIRPLIAMGCEAVTTEVTPEFIHAEALADRRMLWVVFDTDSPFPFIAAASIGSRQTNDGVVVFVDAIGGRDREKWLPEYLAELEAQAKGIGATKIELEGRPGWQRVLPGYRLARVVLEKVLT